MGTYCDKCKKHLGQSNGYTVQICGDGGTPILCEKCLRKLWVWLGYKKPKKPKKVVRLPKPDPEGHVSVRGHGT